MVLQVNKLQKNYKNSSKHLPNFSCFESNLNGAYFSDPVKNGYYQGIIWELWLGDYSLKSAKMMVRPRDWNPVVVVPPDP